MITPNNRPSLWPWQERGIAEAMSLLRQGWLRICVTSPTGCGKGRMIEDMSVLLVEMGARCVIFTDRKMLTRQTGERFAAAGIQFGYVSATLGMETYHNVTVASLQTMRSRLSREKMALPRADVLIIDEAHKTGFDWIVATYRKANPGIIIIGFTATPVGLKEKYDKLVIAGTKEEGRKFGALVPCRVVGMPEPDMRGVKMNKIGEYVHKGMVKRVMQCTVFADIFDEWITNGSDRPTLVWAPGVPESRSIVEEFRKRGITAEHIDGETEDDDRERIRKCSECGSVRVVSSFGVMREGVDWPWVSYGVLVQVCAAYETFIQLVGRILRASPGKVDSILQDHSGTWWRHGNPNADRAWSLADTNTKIQKERAASLSRPKEDSGDLEPVCCPKCHGIRNFGIKCPHCGHESSRSVRMIRSEGGNLVAMEGDVFPKKKQRSATNKRWAATLFRAGSTGMTFAQAAAMHMRETGVWAPNNKECHPIRGPLTDDWNRPVRDVYPGFNKRGVRV